MNDLSGIPGGNSPLVERAKAILLKPGEEWGKIASEGTSIGQVARSYVLPLILIGPVAFFIGSQVFGINVIIATFRPSLATGITQMITSVIFALVSLGVMTLVAEFLAPNFGGEKDRTRAFKLVAYSMTAGWVAGVLLILPSLAAIAGLIGLYGFYLFYAGAAPMMKVPKDKAVVYTAVTVIAAIVLNLVAARLTASVTGMFGGATPSPYAASADGSLSGNIAIPGVGSVDLGKAEQAAKRMEAAVNGQKVATDPAKLEALLPTSIGSYQRTEIESAALGKLGSEAEGTYTSGDNRFRLKIVDMAAAGAFAELGAAVGVQHNRQDANGYERTGTVDGVIQTEKWRNDSHSGSFSRMVANRFLVEADGRAASLDELKAAVATIEAGSLGGG